MKKFTHDILAQPLNPCMHGTTTMHMFVSALIFPKYIPEQGFCRIQNITKGKKNLYFCPKISC